MNPSTRSRVLVPLALCTLAGPAAAAADMKAGDWDVSIGGFINAYYTYADCAGNQAIGGLALATQALGCGGHEKTTVIGNGLLPNALIVGAKSKQAGYDIGATLMIGAAVATGSSIANNSEVDVRQGFLTFGRPEMGTFKLGRDYGIFGSNVILSDMTLLGVGLPTAATQRGRVSLGHLGAGYSYLGTYGEITYTAPTASGFTFSGGLFSPVGNGANAPSATEPQVQAQVVYAMPAGKVWLGAKTQKFDDSAVGAGDAFRMSGVELGGIVDIGAFSFEANVQSGKGLGVLADGDSGDRKQTAVLVQATFKATAELKLGVGYGQTKLKDGVATDLDKNASLTLGSYYKLTPSLTLVGELNRTESTPVVGDKARQNGVSLGAILFF
jgi:predicted porin